MTPRCRMTPLACRAGVWLLVVVGLLLAPAPSQAQEVIEYYGTDHLGSIRVVFDAAGNVVSRADYLPFGEEVFAAGPLPGEHFTGQQRDGEVGLDYFHARQYQPRTVDSMPWTQCSSGPRTRNSGTAMPMRATIPSR